MATTVFPTVSSPVVVPKIPFPHLIRYADRVLQVPKAEVTSLERSPQRRRMNKICVFLKARGA